MFSLSKKFHKTPTTTKYSQYFLKNKEYFNILSLEVQNIIKDSILKQINLALEKSISKYLA